MSRKLVNSYWCFGWTCCTVITLQWKQQIPPKYLSVSAKLYYVATQRTMIQRLLKVYSRIFSKCVQDSSYLINLDDLWQIINPTANSSHLWTVPRSFVVYWLSSCISFLVAKLTTLNLVQNYFT